MQSITSEDAQTVAKPIYLSFFTFLTLLITCGATYATFAFYRDDASDQLKYGGFVCAITALVLCYVLLTRSLSKVGLTIWSLRSVRLCVIASLFQTIVACIYLYAAFYFGFRSVVCQQQPIVYATITCVIAIHGYMLYANIRQTRLIFLSLTIGVFELIASTVVVVLGLLYVFSKSIKLENSHGNALTPTSRRNTIGGFGTYNAFVTINGLPRTVRIQADSAIIAKELLEAQYGQGTVGTPTKES